MIIIFMSLDLPSPDFCYTPTRCFFVNNLLQFILVAVSIALCLHLTLALAPCLMLGINPRDKLWIGKSCKLGIGQKRSVTPGDDLQFSRFHRAQNRSVTLVSLSAANKSSDSAVVARVPF